MHPRWLAILIITGITATVFLLFWFRLQPVWTPNGTWQQSGGATTLTAPTVHFVNPKKGAEKPSVVLVEFGDFQCAACREFAATLDIIVRTVPEVQVVWKNMPNESLHDMAIPAAMAAHCAGEQQTFWGYHDALFERQAVLSKALLLDIAEDLALNINAFENCVNQEETLPLIEKDLQEALALGIPSTPALFVGEEMYIGALEVDEVLAIVRQHLNEYGE
jgi:protein-disulfide isomerase